MIIGNDTNRALLYTKNGSENANLYIRKYDAEAATWSGEMPLTKLGNNEYTETISGLFLDQLLVYVYSERNIKAASEDLIGTNKICWGDYTSKSSALNNSGVQYEETDIVPGTSVPVRMQVENTGTKACRNVLVTVKNGKTEIFSGNEELNLQPGMTSLIEVMLPIPSDYTQTKYSIVVKDTDSKKTTIADFLLGNPVLTLDRSIYCVNGKHQLTASITNSGFGTGAGSLVIYDLNEPEIVYERFDFTDLERDEVLHYTVSLNWIDLSTSSVRTLGLRLKNEDGYINDERTATLVNPEMEAPLSLIAIVEKPLTNGMTGYGFQVTSKGDENLIIAAYDAKRKMIFSQIVSNPVEGTDYQLEVDNEHKAMEKDIRFVRAFLVKAGTMTPVGPPAEYRIS